LEPAAETEIFRAGAPEEAALLQDMLLLIKCKPASTEGYSLVFKSRAMAVNNYL
jgi:hypothetical protein